MNIVPQQIAIAFAFAALIMIPAVPWLLLLRLDRRVIPVELVPGVLAVVTVTFVSLIEIVALTLGWRLRMQLLALACVAVLPIPLLVRHRFARARSFERWSIDRAAGFTGVLTAVCIVVAFLIGGNLSSDALYHVALSVKLQALSAPSFSSIQTFADGGPHPGYLVPASHAIVAFVASLSGAHATTVMLVAPAVLAPIFMLTIAGSSVAIFRSRLSSPIGALAFALVVMSTGRFLFAILQSAYPRELATDLAIPIAIVGVFVALRADDRIGVSRGCVLVAIGTFTTVILHNSYIYILAILLAGYLVGWLFYGRVRQEWKRHLIVGLVPLVIAVVTLAPMIPSLNTLEAFAQSSTVEQVMVENDLPLQPPGLRFGELFIGNKHGYHLRADYLTWRGGLLLLGAMAASVSVLWPRRRASMLLWGTMLIVLILALSDTLFPLLVQATGTSQAKRIYLAVPSTWGLVAFLLGAGTALDRAGVIQRPSLRRLVRAGGIVVIAGVAYLASGLPMETDVLKPHIPVWPIYVALATVCAGVIAGIAFRLGLPMPQRLRRAPDAVPVFGTGTWMTVAATALVIGALPMIVDVSPDMQDRIASREWRTGLRHRGLVPTRRLRAKLIQHQLGAGTIVMAPPEVSYQLTAAAPVYVVGSEPGHQANTKANRVYERFDELRKFYAIGTSDADRLRELVDSQANVVVIYNDAAERRMLARKAAHNKSFIPPMVESDPSLQTLLDTSHAFRRIGAAREYVMYQIDRRALVRHVESDETH